MKFRLKFTRLLVRSTDVSLFLLVTMTSVLRYFTSASSVAKTYLFNCEIKADELQNEIDKLFYFSYRSGFAPLSLNTDPQASVTTDSGWGCTYRFVSCEIEFTKNKSFNCIFFSRAGQMLFAHALNVLLLKNNVSEF